MLLLRNTLSPNVALLYTTIISVTCQLEVSFYVIFSYFYGALKWAHDIFNHNLNGDSNNMIYNLRFYISKNIKSQFMGLLQRFLQE